MYADGFLRCAGDISAEDNLCKFPYWRSMLSDRSVSPPLISSRAGDGAFFCFFFFLRGMGLGVSSPVDGEGLFFSMDGGEGGRGRS